MESRRYLSLASDKAGILIVNKMPAERMLSVVIGFNN